MFQGNAIAMSRTVIAVPWTFVAEPWHRPGIVMTLPPDPNTSRNGKPQGCPFVGGCGCILSFHCVHRLLCVAMATPTIALRTANPCTITGVPHYGGGSPMAVPWDTFMAML